MGVGARDSEKWPGGALLEIRRDIRQLGATAGLPGVALARKIKETAQVTNGDAVAL